MKLSVILVNHNSSLELSLALTSLIKATKSIRSEIIVVDNASYDRSLDILAIDFPGVHVIANRKDEGLSKAYNSAIRLARGQYLLLISAESFSRMDAVEKMLDFMDHHTLAGGLSVRMVDRKGDYLPESKHSLNKSWESFLKFCGMASYFPKSFSVHKTSDWTEEFENTEIDTLNENCMLLRRSALRETGLFDERFFCYGHNIDLSYRLRQHSFKNYYYSKTYIIQLPGKYINKFSWGYIRHFYGAMFIFAAKYLLKLPVFSIKNIGEIHPSSYEIE